MSGDGAALGEGLGFRMCLEGRPGMIGRQTPKSFVWLIASKTQIPASQTRRWGSGSRSNIPEVAKLGGVELRDNGRWATHLAASFSGFCSMKA